MKKISHPTITFLAITTLALTITGWCWNQLSPFLSGIFVFDIKEYFKTSFYGIILCTIWLYTTRKRHKETIKLFHAKKERMAQGYQSLQKELKQKEIQIEQLQYKLTCQQSDINKKATLQKELRNLNAQRDILLQEIIQHSDARTKIEHILIDYKQKGHSKETLSEKDWRSLANELDQKDIILQYSNQFCFTPSEQNYCYLLLTDYSATDRGKLLQLTRQTVYRREHDILTKLGENYEAGKLKNIVRKWVN